MDLTSQKLEKQNVSFFDAPFMKQRVNSFFGGQDFAMKGAGFAAADDDDDAVLGHYMFEEEDEEFAHADIASEDDLQLSQAVVSEEPLGPVERLPLKMPRVRLACPTLQLLASRQQLRTLTLSRSAWVTAFQLLWFHAACAHTQP